MIFVRQHVQFGNVLANEEYLQTALRHYRHALQITEENWQGQGRDAGFVFPDEPVYTGKPMGDKNEHLRTVADDEGLTVDQVREAIDAWKAAKGELTAVIEDSPLARLRLRFAKRLREIELPADGFSTKAQADAAHRLSATLYQLQATQTGLGLPVTEKPERVREAERLRTAYLRSHDGAGLPVAVRPRGRPRRDAAQEVGALP